MPHMKMCELAHARWLEIFKGGLFKLVKMPELLYVTYLKAQDSPGGGGVCGWRETKGNVRKGEKNRVAQVGNEGGRHM